MAVALGINTRTGIGSAIPTTVQLETLNVPGGLAEDLVDTSGLRGTRDTPANRTRQGTRAVQFPIELQPTPVEWAAIWPFVQGGVPAGTNYPYAEVLPNLAVQVTKGTKMFNYAEGKAARLTIRGTPGAPLAATLDYFGEDEAAALASAFPALTLDTTTTPFMFSDSSAAIVVNGVTLDCLGLTIVVDNLVQARYPNSQVATEIYSTGRLVTWEFDLPYGDAEALYGLAATGVPVSATFTNGATSMALSSPKLIVPRNHPEGNGRDEIRLPIRGRAGYNATPGDSLVVTLDSSP